MKEKLVIDNNAAVFFRMALEQAEKSGLVTCAEFHKYDIRNLLVNMEGAEWVVAIKHNIQKIQAQVNRIDEHTQALQTNLTNLRAVLVQKEEAEVRREQMVSLISMTLFMIGRPVFKVLQGALDLATPLNLVLATVQVSPDDVGKWLTDKTAEIVFQPESTVC